MEWWIKLYTEILDDPEMALMPDRLWRRVIELFLIAGKVGKDGHLPRVRQMAWLLRIPPDDLELDIQQLIPTGIISQDEAGRLIVTNFARRQAPSPTKERSKRYRERKRMEEEARKRDAQHDTTVTQASRNVTPEPEPEPEQNT